MGQHLVFVVPDSVMEPTVAPPVHPSEASNVSCTLQKLTSDPDIYTVPLDGCGVNKQVFGQTVVHLLEVHGVHALQENSPVRPVYVEVSLLDAPEPGLVLLVHSCLAYTPAPYTSWMLVYDGRGDSQLLPSLRSDPHHIRRILISGFLSLPSESPPYMAEGGHTHLEDPEIYFLRLAEVCSAADGDCTVGCINSPSSDV